MLIYLILFVQLYLSKNHQIMEGGNFWADLMDEESNSSDEELMDNDMQDLEEYSSSSESDQDMTIGGEALPDKFGKTMSDLFYRDYTDKWMCLIMNSDLLLTKGVLEDGQVFFEFDCKCLTINLDWFRTSLSMTTLSVEVHFLDSTISNFDLSQKKTYTSKMEVCKADSYMEAINEICAIMDNNLDTDPKELKETMVCSKHLEGIFTAGEDFMIMKVNFFPTETIVRRFSERSVALMVPSGKVMTSMEIPDLIEFSGINRVTDSRITFNFVRRPITKKFNDNPIMITQLSFFNKNKNQLKKMDSRIANPSTLIKLFKKPRKRNIKPTPADTQSITDTISKSLPANISMNWVAKYLSVRSTIMEDCVANYLSLQWPTEEGGLGPWVSEQPVSQLYPELSGMSMLTPDLVVCEKTTEDWEVCKAVLSILTDSPIQDDCLYFIDIKVSDWGSDLSVNSTSAKYAGFCNMINNRFILKEKKTRAYTKVIQFNLSDRSAMSDLLIRSKMHSSLASEMLSQITSHWESELKGNSDYNNLKRAYERKEEEEVDLSAIDLLFGKYKLLNPDHLFKDSFAKNHIFCGESELLQEILSFQMTSEEAATELHSYKEKIYDKMYGNMSPDFAEVSQRLAEAPNLDEALRVREDELSNRNPYDYSTTQLSNKRAFKVPLLQDTGSEMDVRDMRTLFRNSYLSQDGTLFVSGNEVSNKGLMDSFWLPNNQMTDEEHKMNKLGANYDESIAEMVENCIMDLKNKKSTNPKLSKMIDESLEGLTWTDQAKSSAKEFMMSKQFEMMMYLQEVVQQIVQIEGRRTSYVKEEGRKVRKGFREFRKLTPKKFCAFRSIGPFIVEVKNGPKLKRNSNLRFRIWASRSAHMWEHSNEFHSFHAHNSNEFSSTKYLSIQPIDLVTYLNCFEATMMLSIGFFEKVKEETKSDSTPDEFLMSLSVRLFQLIEHRNNTSMAAQLSRYLLVGNSGLFADRKSLISEIGSDVIRSKFQMYTISRQLRWTKRMSRVRTDFLTRAFTIQEDTMADQTSCMVPSFYCDVDMPLPLLLDEIYFCNLLDPNYGTRKHMTEATFKKMAKMEILWRSKISDPEKVRLMRGLARSEGWVHSKDKETFFLFDRAIVFATVATVMRSVSIDNLMRQFLVKMFEPMTELMTLKSNVMETLGNTIYDHSNSFREVRKTAFETQSMIVKKYMVTTVLDTVNLFNHFDYYFAEFPKPQIGGPREILIQDMFSRTKARLLENFFNMLNKQFENEMTSNASKKFTRQANMDHTLESALSEKERKPVRISLANNKDHSKWSPSTNIIQYAYMVMPMNIGERLKEFLVVAIMAYSSAKVGMPLQMSETLDNMGLKKVMEEKEEEIGWMYNQFVNGGSGNAIVTIKSGWPQGMLQFASSTYHVMEKALMKMVWEDLSGVVGVNWAIFDMITSDDTTDYMVIEADGVDKISSFISLMLSTGYIVGKSFNLHENKKKTNLQLVIKEFNSIFQVGRSVLTPMIKFLVKSVAIPDFTYPEEAAKELISMEQMLLLNGASYNILKASRVSHRRTLRVGYNQNQYEDELCEKLNCKVEELPIELGFLPKDRVMETAIYGADVIGLTQENSSVTEFVERLFTNNKETFNFFSVDKTSYMGDFMIKEKLKLPMKLDRKMKELKTRVGVSDSIVNEIANKRFDVMMESKDSPFILTSTFYKMMGINVRFSIDTGFLYRAHSMVRANQINSEISSLSRTSKTPVKTIVDFVDMILKNEGRPIGVISNHPMRSVMVTANQIFKEVEGKVKSGEVLLEDMSKKPKYREVLFCNQEVYPTLNSSDTYRLFRTKPSLRNTRDSYKSNIMQKFYNFTTSFYDDNIVKSLLSEGRLNAMTLVSFFENMSSMMKTFKSTLPTDEPPSSNASLNFLSLVRTRMFPGKVVKEMDLDTEHTNDLVRVSEIADNMASLPALASDMKQMKMLCDAYQRDLILSKPLSYSENLSNLEKMVWTLNVLAQSDLSRPTTVGDLMFETPNLTLYSETTIPPNVVSDKAGTCRVIYNNNYHVQIITTADQYSLIVFYESEEVFPEVEKVIKRNRPMLGNKSWMSFQLNNVGTEGLEEVAGLEVLRVSSSLVDPNAALIMDLRSRKGAWEVTTEKRAMIGFSDQVSCQFKVFTSKNSSLFPILSPHAIAVITDPMLKMKMKAISSPDTPVSSLNDHEKSQLSKLWMTQSEADALLEVFSENKEDDEMVDFVMNFEGMQGNLFEMMASFALPTQALEAVEDVEERRTRFEDMAMEEEEFAPESIFSILSNIPRREARDSWSDQNEEMNKEDLKKKSLAALTKKVKDYILNTLKINIGSIRTSLRNSADFFSGPNSKFTYSRAYYDMLVCLKRRLVYRESESVSSETFILVAKVFLSMVVKKDQMINIERHSFDRFVMF